MTSKEKLLQLRHDFYLDNSLNYDSISYFTSIEKDLEILEIIKKHKPSFFRLDFCKSASQYNKIYEDGTCPKIMNYKILSEEEFNLLKEWLENENKNIN